MPTPTTTTGVNDQTCTDSFGSSAWNKGKLDVRVSNCSTLGYKQENGRGVYRISGSTKRYPDTSTRVERFFNYFNAAPNTSGTFRVVGLSDAQTYIAQGHATGKITKGTTTEVGKTARSAIFLVRTLKKGKSTTEYYLDIEESDQAYFEEDKNAGHRIFHNQISLNYNQDYRIEVTTGYNSSSAAYTIINIYSGTRLMKNISINHKFTASATYLRYGAYSAGDSGDTTAEVNYTGVGYCFTN